MMNNIIKEETKCIYRDKKTMHPTDTLCGKENGFIQDLDHALMCINKKSLVQPCPECLIKAIDAQGADNIYSMTKEWYQEIMAVYRKHL